VVGVFVFFAGCGGGGSPPARTPAPSAAPTAAAATRTPAPPPALCDGKLRVRVLGHATGPTELSGLARSSDGTFWTHNDSGDGPRLFHLSKTGTVLGEVTLANATAVDWEDIAIRGRMLYVGDIGDNARQRPDIAVYRVLEGSSTAAKITLHYPDGPHDAEALLVDPKTGSLTIVTKELTGSSGVYTGLKLRKAASLRLGLGQAVTGGDVSADGRTIVLRTYTTAFVWRRRGSESLASAMQRAPCAADADLLDEGQGEAIALNPRGTAFYTIPEGANPALRRYS